MNSIKITIAKEHTRAFIECSYVLSVRRTPKNKAIYIFYFYSSKFKDFGKNTDIFFIRLLNFTIKCKDINKTTNSLYKNVKLLNNESNSVKKQAYRAPFDCARNGDLAIFCLSRLTLCALFGQLLKLRCWYCVTRSIGNKLSNFSTYFLLHNA